MARLAPALALLASLAPAAAADPVAAGHVLHTIYGESRYETEIDRVLREADSKAVFGGADSMEAARARNRSLTRQAMLVQREAVLRDASGRVAALATDDGLTLLLRAAEHPGAPVDEAALSPALTAVRRGFAEAAWDQVARYAQSNARMLCRQGERSYCP